MIGRAAGLGCALATAALVAGCGSAAPPAPGAQVAPSLDLAALVQRARLAYRPDGQGGHGGGGPGFAVRVTRDGEWILSPRAEGQRPSAGALTLGRATLSRGGVPSGPARVEPDGALATPRGAGVEWLRNTPAGVEQSWSFPAPPPGRGDLRISLPASGLPYVGSTASGLHFRGRAGPGVRYGHATWVDASGRHTPVPARWTGSAVELAVPEQVLDQASYPALLDPVVSAELDLDVPVVGPAPDAQSAPAVAFDGTRYLVAWSDRRSGESGAVFAARVALDGTVLDPVGIPVASGSGEVPDLGVAAGAGGFLVAWVGGTRYAWSIQARRVAPDGTLADPPIRIGASAFQGVRAAIAYDGADFRFAWTEYDEPFGNTSRQQLVSVARLPGRGSDPVPPTRIQGAYDRALELAPRPALACAGERCMVAFTSTYGGVGTLLVDRAGSVVSRSGPLDVAPAAPALDWDGSRYLLVWQDDRTGSGRADVMGQLFDESGVRVGTSLAIAEGGDRVAPCVAFDGLRHLVVWEERTPGGGDLAGVRVDPDGAVLRDVLLPVATAPGEQRRPALAASPQGALAVYGDTRADSAGDVYATRIGPDGAVADPAGRRISSATNREVRPAVAFAEGRWLIVWQDSRASGDHLDGIYAARVAVDGTILDPTGFVISDGPMQEANPAAAGCGEGWVVAWEDYRNGGSDVYAARVGGDGVVRDPDAIAVATGSPGQSEPAVACSGGTALVAWEAPRATTSWAPGGALQATRIAATGSILDTPPLAVSSRTSGGPPAVAAGAGGFLLSWQYVDAQGDGSVLAARVAGDAGVEPEVTVCGGPGLRGAPAVAFDGTGYRIVFEDQRTAPATLRTVGLTPAGTPVDPCGEELPGTAGGTRPRIAHDGARDVVIWRSQPTGEVLGASLSPGGGVLETYGVAPGEAGAARPDLACDAGGRCLVAYERIDPALGVSRARMRLVTSAAPAPRCTAPSECGSGNCVDGVCCDTACGGGDPGDCLACSVAAGAPADGACAPIAAGQVCGARGGTCRPARRCDGSGGGCPDAQDAPDGTPCDDGDACTLGEACRAGTCAPGEAVACTSWGQCDASSCDPLTGVCSSAVVLDAPCDDGDPCTERDRCTSTGACRGTPRSCPAQDGCHSGQCDPTSGACIQVAYPDGAWCNDGNACTAASKCTAGVCVGSAPVLCPAPDACHQPGLCDRSTGACVYAAREDGSPCDDGDRCTNGDACQAGACHGQALACAAIDACHQAGVCDPSTGTCSSPPAPDGTACDDGDRCTSGDGCKAGVCRGQAVACAAIDACHQAGVCDPSTGTCSTPPAPDGTACDDGDACTRAHACASGMCVGSDLVVCADPGSCQVAACEPASGSCLTSPAPDGTACPGGHCRGGRCRTGSGGGGCSTGASAGLPALAVAALLALLARRSVRRRDALARVGEL